jgi:hypothetical protein
MTAKQHKPIFSQLQGMKGNFWKFPAFWNSIFDKARHLRQNKAALFDLDTLRKTSYADKK